MTENGMPILEVLQKKKKNCGRCHFIIEFQVKPVAKHKRCAVAPAPVRPPALLTQLCLSTKQFPICGYTGNDPKQQRIRTTSTLKYKSSECFQVQVEIYGSYINNCPTKCNTKQSIYYSASSLYTFRVSNTPIIRITQNCTYSLRYWSYFLCSYLPATWPS
jgi:hypothetical protein